MLEACDWRDGLPLTRVAQKAFVNVQDCKMMLEKFLRKGYVQQIPFGNRFRYKLTNDGRGWILKAKSIMENNE